MILYIPPTGNQPVFIAIYSSKRAKKKLGIANPRKAKTEINLSSQEYCLTAERIPKGIDNTQVKIMALRERMKVLYNLLLIKVKTGSL